MLLQVVSAYGHEPVATTSLLAYVLCHELHDSLEDKIAWLGILGTFGDLGSSVKWDPPFPDMGSAIKQHGGKTKYSQAVSLLNARESQKFSSSICCNNDAIGQQCILGFSDPMMSGQPSSSMAAKLKVSSTPVNRTLLHQTVGSVLQQLLVVLHA